MRTHTIPSALLCLCIFVPFVGVSEARAAEARPLVEADPLIQFQSQLATRVPELLAEYRIPGLAVGVIEDGSVVMAQGYGHTRLDAEVPITSATVFNVASISKNVSALGAMKLVEAREIDLDEPVSSYLTRWQLPESAFDNNLVTLRGLLSHTAGMSVRAIGTYEVDEPLPTLEEALVGSPSGAGKVFVQYKPGEYHYSGGGYTVLQLLIEEVSGVAFAEFMDKKIFQPLGMDSSSYEWTDQIASKAATPYEGGKPIPPVTHTAQAGGSLQTTIDDFLRFMLLSVSAMDSAVLRPETISEMQQIPHGLGYDVRVVGTNKVVNHAGGNRGWNAYYAMFVEAQSGIAIFSNGSAGSSIVNTVFSEWLKVFRGIDAMQPRNTPEFPVELDVGSLQTVVGEYLAPNGLVWDFRLVDGRLKVYADAGNMYVYPRSATEFFVYPLDTLSFKFVLDERGQASSLLLGPSRDGPWTELSTID